MIMMITMQQITTGVLIKHFCPQMRHKGPWYVAKVHIQQFGGIVGYI